MFQKPLLILFLIPITIFSQPSETYFGVQTHFGQFYRADMDSASMIKMLDSAEAAGIKTIRDECYWADVETSPGVYNFPANIDNYVNAAAERSIKIIMILNYNNPLYAPHAGSGITTDSNRAAFAAYCSKVVERYSPKGVKIFEVWNEPNIPMFWDPAPSAQAYAALLQAVYPVIKQTDSTVQVIGCATSPAEGNPPPFIQWNTFISQVKNYGGLNYLDGVSFHLYRVDKAPELWLANDIAALKQIIGANKSIWLTESGYPTSSVWPNLNKIKQAQYIVRLYLLGRKYAELESVVYYDLKNDGEEPGNNEHNFGILNFNLTPKPAYTALKTLTAAIGYKELTSAFSTGVLYRYTFESTSEKTEAFWTISSALTKNESFDQNTLKITDMYDGSFYVYDSDKSYPVTYTESPLYITPMTALPAVQAFSIKPDINQCVPKQRLKLRLEGTAADGNRLLIDSSGAAWEVLDTLASVTSGGTLTPLHPGITTIKCVFMGTEVYKTMNILPSYDILEIEPFDHIDSLSWSIQNMLGQTSLQLIDSNYTSPQHSLLIQYAFNFIGIDQHKLTFNFNKNLPGEPDTLSLDVFNNGNRHVFEFTLIDSDGEVFRVNTPPGALYGKFGWSKVSVPLNKFGTAFNYPARLERAALFFVHNSPDTLNSGSILLDNIRIHSGLATSIEQGLPLPEDFTVSPNYPNPFNPYTRIKVTIPGGGASGRLRASVINLLGEEVAVLADGQAEQGEKIFLLDSAALASGVYFFRAVWENKTKTIKMLLLK